MLLSLFSLTCLLAVHLAGSQCIPPGLASPKAVQTGNNYAVDAFSGFPFAFAIGYCTATGVSGTYAIYTCEDNGASITKTTYLTYDCSDDDGTTTSNAVPQFECGGQNNYVTLEVSISDDTCKTGVTVYAGLGACVDDEVFMSQIYCNDTEAIVQFYLPYYPSPPSPPPPPPSTTVAPEMSSSSSMMPEMSSSSSSMMPEMSSSSSSMMPEMSSSSSSMIEEMSSSSSSMIEEMSSSSSSMIEEMSSSSSSMIEMSSSSSMIEEMSSSSSMIEVTVPATVPPLQYCNDKLFCLTWTFATDSSCQYAGPLPTGKLVYGSMGSCELNVGSTNSKKKSASSLVAIINLIVGFAVALFSLF